MSPDKRVYTANQVATFFQPDAEKPGKVAGHLNDFWDPGMRRQPPDSVASGGAGLDLLVIEAAAQVHEPVS